MNERRWGQKTRQETVASSTGSPVKRGRWLGQWTCPLMMLKNGDRHMQYPPRMAYTVRFSQCAQYIMNSHLKRGSAQCSSPPNVDQRSRAIWTQNGCKCRVQCILARQKRRSNNSSRHIQHKGITFETFLVCGHSSNFHSLANVWAYDRALR
jgi:hypothetical protein